MNSYHRSGPDSPRVAVVGCGYWGQNLVRNFHRLGALTVVCDATDSGRAKALALAPEVEVVKDIGGVLSRKDIDAVVLATPAETHCGLTLQALAAGKDVLVEKPMAMDCRQGREMRDLAAHTGRILMVGHLLEFHPAVLELKRLIEEGALGRVNYIYSNRLNFGKIRTEENALWSFAPHDIAVILRLVGEKPMEVTCAGGSYVTAGLADVTVSTLRFPSGVRAHIYVSWLHPFKEQKLVVIGERQMAQFNDVSLDEKLLLYPQNVRLGEDRQPILTKGDTIRVALATDEPLQKECEHFLHCVRTRQTPLTDADSGLEVLRVLEACQLSLQRNGQPTQLQE